MAITKKQTYIDENYKFRFSLNDKQIEKTIPPMAFFNGKNTICLECGEKSLGKAKKCQKCGVRYSTIEETKKRVFTRYGYYDIIKKFKNYLVQECYQVIKYYKNGKSTKKSSLVWTKFIDEKGKVEIKTLKTANCFYAWQWSLDSGYHWYKPHFSYTYLEKYTGYCKNNEIKSFPNFIKNARLKVSYNNLGKDIIDLINTYLKAPTQFETFVELGAFDILKVFVDRNNDDIKTLSKSIFKVLSKPYIVKTSYGDNSYNNYLEYIGNDNINNYIEYLKECNELGYNIMQDHILTPQSLGQAHARTSKQIMKKRDKNDIEKNEEKYQKRINKYLGVDLGNENYEIKILPTVESFFEEGSYMHHCVFSMKYYNRDNSLVFSVRNRKTNERIETAEILIDKKEINQCYGKFDKLTEFHKEILDVINDNMSKLWKISKINTNANI